MSTVLMGRKAETIVLFNSLKRDISVSIVLPSRPGKSREEIKIAKISAKDKVTVPNGLFVTGNMIEILVESETRMGTRSRGPPKSGLVPYSTLMIDNTYKDVRETGIIYIGMHTTRFIGTTDVTRSSTISQAEGNAWVNIHNTTRSILRLNDFSIPPLGMVRYRGELDQGVRFGTIFKNKDGLYDDFQYLQPHTDLYYGIVSNTLQPLYGGFQISFSEEVDTDQTLWPLQNGI